MMRANGSAEWKGNVPAANGTITAGNTTGGVVHVPGFDEVAFSKHSSAAQDGCLAGSALAGVPEITLNASLVR